MRLALVSLLLTVSLGAAERPAHHSVLGDFRARVASVRSAHSLRRGPRGPATALQDLAAALPAGMGLEEVRRVGAHRTLRFRYRGLPVEPDRVIVSSTPTRWSQTGAVPPAAPVRGAARLTEDEARARAVAHGGVRRYQAAPVEPCLVRLGGGYRVAYRVEVHSWDPPAHLEVLVDAADGAVLVADDLASAADGDEYEAVAAVWPTHADQSELADFPVRHLTRRGRLKGRFVSVENEDMSDAYATDDRFDFPPESKHLDEAMVYVHAERAREFFAGLGFEPGYAPLPAAVYYGDKYDNAMFLGWAPALVFGDGHRYRPLSREAAVVIHEYTHAVTYAMTQLGSFGEAGAMNEGFSDYFAAALTGDPKIGEYVVAPTGRPYMRHLVNTLRYPDDMAGESHDDARIFGGALWALREAVGGAVADPLVHEARKYLTRESTFLDAREAIREEDQRVHGGAHDDAVLAAFAGKGIE